MKLKKEEYEGRMLLKPKSKKNPDGASDGDIVTVRKVESVKLPQTGDTWMVTFREYPENALALNKTNLKEMVTLFGDETDDWLKEKVQLTIVNANDPHKNKMVESIRIKGKDWKYGDDEDEHNEGDETEQPEEPMEDEVEEEKAKKVQARRKK
jgi:hypothetical protein